MKASKIALIVAASIAVAACGSKGTRDTGSDAERVDSGARTEGVGDRGPAQGTPLTDEQRLRQELDQLAASGNVVYFDYDRAEVLPDGMPILQRYADFLVKNPDARVRLEGHTDERGTREYNVGLGERRSQSVAQILRARGVSGDQLEIISYGKERPAQLGSNEAAWAKNRRVEIVYR